MNTIKGQILSGQDWIEGEISFAGKIQSITGKEINTLSKDLPVIIPGFIDLHVHGGGGSDVMQAGKAIEQIAQTHARFGTTSFLATTMTAPMDEINSAFVAIRDSKITNGAKVVGVHLEGPFISSEKLGAQPNFTREAIIQEIETLHQIFPIKVLTLAPEIKSHIELISKLHNMGIVVQLGHSNASYEETCSALEAGAKSFTHLFNAMSGFHHRHPGMAVAALAHAEFSEIIPDLLHVHPGAIRAALRSIPHLYCVTDATSATGMPDGDYKLGTQIVHKCLGGVRLKDGTLAGSCLTTHQAFLNLIQIGLTPMEASNRLSQIPANLIGLSHRGRLERDFVSDVLVLNSDFSLKEVYVEGVKIER